MPLLALILQWVLCAAHIAAPLLLSCAPAEVMVCVYVWPQNVGQNNIELWNFKSGGGWIHPIHVHLVVSVPCSLCCMLSTSALGM
jgi:hypothetical protein